MKGKISDVKNISYVHIFFANVSHYCHNFADVLQLLISSVCIQDMSQSNRFYGRSLYRQ